VHSVNEVTRNKIRQTLKTRWSTMSDLERKKNLAGWHTNLIPWNKGKKASQLAWNKDLRLTVEHRKHLSESHKGHLLPEQQKLKISLALKGRKLSSGMLGHKRSQEWKQKMSNLLKGRRLSLGMTGHLHSSESKQRMSLARMGHCPSQETRRKMSITWSGEAAKKLSQARRLWWANLPDEEKGKKLTKWHRPTKPTSIEIAVQTFLTGAGIDFVSQKRIGSYLIDFYLPKQNIAIECDGEYWHGLPKTKARDKRRDLWLSEKGHEVIRLPEKCIRSKRFIGILEGRLNLA